MLSKKYYREHRSLPSREIARNLIQVDLRDIYFWGELYHRTGIYKLLRKYEALRSFVAKIRRRRRAAKETTGGPDAQ